MHPNTVDSAGTIRVRRHRDRRRRGLRSVSVELSEEEITYFARIRRLALEDLSDRNALSNELRRFLNDAFVRARRPGKLGTFTVELGQEPIDHLVRRGRLAPGERHDPDAVLRVFSQIVHEAFGRL